MPVDFRLLFAAALLLAPSIAPAQESDPPLELIELLGEMDDVEADLDIALKDVEVRADETGDETPEVKNED